MWHRQKRMNITWTPNVCGAAQRPPALPKDGTGIGLPVTEGEAEPSPLW